MTNALPLTSGAGVESLKSNLEQKSNVHERAGLYAGKILQILGQAPIPGGFLQEIRDRGYSVQKDQSYQQVRIRVNDLHAFLDEKKDIELHPIAVVGNATPVSVGSVVQVSFEDNFSSKGGFVVSAAGGIGGKGNTNNDDTSHSGNRKAGKFPAGGGRLAAGKEKSKQNLLETFTAPFTIEVKGKTSGVRLELIKELETIALVAGWYYGVKFNSTVYVTSGFRAAKPEGKPADKGNHSSGNAADYYLVLDGLNIGYAESFSFVNALRAAKQASENVKFPKEQFRFSPMGVGIYSGNGLSDEQIAQFYRISGTSARPHFDIRIKTSPGWHWFRPAKNNKGGRGQTSKTYKEFIEKDNTMHVALNIIERVNQIFEGITTPEGPYAKNQDLWTALKAFAEEDVAAQSKKAEAAGKAAPVLAEANAKNAAREKWNSGGLPRFPRYGIDYSVKGQYNFKKDILTDIKFKAPKKKSLGKIGIVYGMVTGKDPDLVPKPKDEDAADEES